MIDKARGEPAQAVSTDNGLRARACCRSGSRQAHASARPRCVGVSWGRDQTVPFGLFVGGNRSCSSAGIVPTTSTASTPSVKSSAEGCHWRASRRPPRSGPRRARRASRIDCGSFMFAFEMELGLTSNSCAMRNGLTQRNSVTNRATSELKRAKARTTAADDPVPCISSWEIVRVSPERKSDEA